MLETVLFLGALLGFPRTEGVLQHSMDKYFHSVRYRSLLTGADMVVRTPNLPNTVDSSCLVDDIHCVLENGNIIDAFFSVNSSQACQFTCAQSSSVKCAAFTWFASDHPIFPNSCFLFSSCLRARKSERTVSGPPSCSCGTKSACQGVKGNFVKFKENVASERTCQNLCSGNPRCRFYTWFGAENKIFAGYCFLFSSCEKRSCNCKDCFSGPPRCFEYTLVQDLSTSSSTSNSDSETNSNSVASSSFSGDLDSVADRPQTFIENTDFEPPLVGSVIGAVPTNSLLNLGTTSELPQHQFVEGGVIDGTDGKYKNTMVNYMPALKWLLVLMKNNKGLDDNPEEKM